MKWPNLNPSPGYNLNLLSSSHYWQTYTLLLSVSLCFSPLGTSVWTRLSFHENHRLWSSIWGCHGPCRAVKLLLFVLLYRWVNRGWRGKVTLSSPQDSSRSWDPRKDLWITPCFMGYKYFQPWELSVRQRQHCRDTCAPGSGCRLITKLLFCGVIVFFSLSHFGSWLNLIYFSMVQLHKAIGK